MTIVIPAGFGQCTYELKATGDPQPWNLVTGFEATNEGTGAAYALTLLDAFVSHVLPQIHDSVVLTGAKLSLGQSGGADPIVSFFNSGENGDTGGDMLPQNSAVLVSKNTAFGGRKNRGRMFIPLMAESSQVDNVGNIATTKVNFLQSGFTAFLDKLSGPSVIGGIAAPMVILHNDTGASTPDPTPVTSLTVKSVIATQRRRLR